VISPAPQLADRPPTPAAAPTIAARYTVLGVPIAVSSNAEAALQVVDETYAAFRDEFGAPAPAFAAELIGLAGESGATVRDSGGYERAWPEAQAALIDLLDRIVHGVLAELHRRDIYAIHAGALVDRGAALVVAGRSGQGKTTLTLGLLRRGLGLLSDEFAVIDPASQRIMPYRRSLHIRPGTPELIPELRGLAERPRRQLGGGVEWSVTPDELAEVFPGCLAASAPLRYVILLDGAPDPSSPPALTPAPAALATIELLRGTWAASRDFAAGLSRLSRLMSGVTCARLRAGALEPTLDAIGNWLEAHRGS
jgi:hypothetical protein